jgi:hypothetical protein
MEGRDTEKDDVRIRCIDLCNDVVRRASFETALDLAVLLQDAETRAVLIGYINPNDIDEFFSTPQELRNNTPLDSILKVFASVGKDF